MRESQYQRNLKQKLRERFDGCVILKNDCNCVQGIPDLLILYNEHWAMLECKRSKSAAHRPNQDYWIKELNAMSYATFIYPENEEEVLNELGRVFKS